VKLRKPVKFTFRTAGITLLLLLSALLTACQGDTGPAPQDVETTTRVLPDLTTTTATLAGHSLRLWLARTYQEKARGLMYIEAIADDQGMLFIYDSPRIMSFWMKNTRIPLDLVFLGANLEINGWIKEMQPGYGLAERSLPHYESEIPAQYAIELNAGSIERLGLKPGDKLEIPLTLLYSE
jgi:uncharacterized membrane protein (UPF0127 family)